MKSGKEDRCKKKKSIMEDRCENWFRKKKMKGKT